MRVVFTKGSDRDSIDVQRADGTTTTTRFPKKGVIPHDAVHLIVERTLGLRNAFWGLVNAGANPADVAQMSKDGGHASASRAGVPALLSVSRPTCGASLQRSPHSSPISTPRVRNRTSQRQTYRRNKSSTSESN